MGFFDGGIRRLMSSVLTKDAPAYVQFYVTSRCNLACEQCNIIYANADQQEATLNQCRDIARNLARIGTSVVLLTGGEPFARKDIVEIAKVFKEAGVHPRIQTNGLARPEQLQALVAEGICDISISLDSLEPDRQDRLNGGVANSWNRAIRTIAMVNEVFPKDAFCALGCVLSPKNMDQVANVIRFATEIGWWVSLVPAHVTEPSTPRNFMTYDKSMRFSPNQYGAVKNVLDDVKQMRDSGMSVYDSDEYLDDIYRFITGEPVKWRRRNGGLCDAPNLYFAIQPNGDMAVCCDHRMPASYPVYDADFPKVYRSGRVREQARAIKTECTGCMYGSFPEITITSRYLSAMLKRARLFLLGHGRRTLKRMSEEEMLSLAQRIVEGK